MNGTASSNLWQRVLIAWGSLVLIMASLYWARPVLMPVVVAILMTFILSPIVTAVQRWRVGRVAAALVVVLLTSGVLAVIAWGFGYQMQALLEELPKHKHTIVEKINAIQGQGRGPLADVVAMIQEIGKELEVPSSSRSAAPPAAEAIPVIIHDRGPALPFDWLPSIAGSVVEVLAALALIFILVVFMLIQREDLRNRLIRVLSRGRLTHTTRALDDAAQRISRFLATQLFINMGFGVALSAGLLVLGMPYALFWGLLTGLARFIPYLGSWLMIGLLLVFSIAVFPGWTVPLAVFGLFLALELLTYYLAEPLLLGRGTGVSPIALLLSAVFWAWLWGPVGLILATPLTVCFMVLGKNVPELAFLDILLGDEPGLAPWETFYQRLLASDEDEAGDLLEQYAQEHTPAALADDMLMPALVQVKSDAKHGEIDRETRRWILQTIQQMVAELPIERRSVQPSDDTTMILACPAADEIDQAALRLFVELMSPIHGRVEQLSADTLGGECVARVEQEQAAVVLLTAVAPAGLVHCRYLCKRLRAAYPHLKIIVGYWGSPSNREEDRHKLQMAGADAVESNIQQTQKRLSSFLPMAPAAEERTALAAAH